MVVLTPPPTKLGDISSPVDTSSQVGALDDPEMGETSLEEIPAVLSPLAKTPGPSGDTPLHGCRPPLQRGQHGPKGSTSYQAIHQSPLAEIGLGAEHGSLPK